MPLWLRGRRRWSVPNKLLVRIARYQGAGGSDDRAGTPDHRPDADPRQVEAGLAFADELALGRMTSLREVPARLSIGLSRTQRIRAHPAALTNG